MTATTGRIRRRDRRCRASWPRDPHHRRPSRRPIHLPPSLDCAPRRRKDTKGVDNEQVVRSRIRRRGCSDGSPSSLTTALVSLASQRPTSLCVLVPLWSVNRSGYTIAGADISTSAQPWAAACQCTSERYVRPNPARNSGQSRRHHALLGAGQRHGSGPCPRSGVPDPGRATVVLGPDIWNTRNQAAGPT